MSIVDVRGGAAGQPDPSALDALVRALIPALHGVGHVAAVVATGAAPKPLELDLVRRDAATARLELALLEPTHGLSASDLDVFARIVDLIEDALAGIDEADPQRVVAALGATVRIVVAAGWIDPRHLEHLEDTS